MSSSNIRRTELSTKTESSEALKQLSNGGISVSEISHTYVDPLCDDYPYPEQPVYSGEITYTEDAMWGTGREYPIKFQYRTEAEILILNSDVDVPLESIITRLNQSAPEEVKIYRNLTPSREKLWNFFESADRIIDLFVLDESGRKVSKEEIEAEGDRPTDLYPIEDATVVFKTEEGGIVVQYEQGSLHIKSDWGKASEYIVQLFERDVISD